MKLTLSALLITLAASLTNATPAPALYQTTVKPLFIDPKSDIADLQVAVAGVTYNRAQQTMTVVFQSEARVTCLAIGCPPSIQTKEVTLPVQSIETTSCGSTLYTAALVSAEFKNENRELRFTDNRGNKCPTFVALSAVELEYSYSSIEAGRTHLTFRGEEPLAPVVPRPRSK
ncbi:MAG: hypothetical protein KF681_15140 [Bdellovibrionaceae bacterium]|nr:hypothetical protein [Pseudobdellovibrionaceae bacterium]